MQPIQLALMILAGWINEEQQQVIVDLIIRFAKQNPTRGYAICRASSGQIRMHKSYQSLDKLLDPVF